MARSRISQREAHRLRKRVEELEVREQRRIARYSSEYPGGSHIATIDGLSDNYKGRLYVADVFGAALVGRLSGGTLLIYAVLPKESA